MRKMPPSSSKNRAGPAPSGVVLLEGFQHVKPRTSTRLWTCSRPGRWDCTKKRLPPAVRTPSVKARPATVSRPASRQEDVSGGFRKLKVKPTTRRAAGRPGAAPRGEPLPHHRMVDGLPGSPAPHVIGVCGQEGLEAGPRQDDVAAAVVAPDQAGSPTRGDRSPGRRLPGSGRSISARWSLAWLTARELGNSLTMRSYSALAPALSPARPLAGRVQKARACSSSPARPSAGTRSSAPRRTCLVLRATARPRWPFARCTLRLHRERKARNWARRPRRSALQLHVAMSRRARFPDRVLP